MDGDVTDAQFAPDTLHRPGVAGAGGKIKVHRDAALNERYPRGIPNRLTVTLADGRKLVKEVEFPRGHARNPMTDAEVEQKFRAHGRAALRQGNAPIASWRCAGSWRSSRKPAS